MKGSTTVATSNGTTLEIDNSENEETEFESLAEESDISIATSDSDSASEGSDAEEPVNYNEWTSNFSEMTVEDFKEQNGALLPDGFDAQSATPLDYFSLMIGPKMMCDIARYTNNYAKWVFEKSGWTDPDWKITSANEIRGFIGMEIMNGVQPMADSSSIWAKNPYYGKAGVAPIMSASRYHKLKQYFCVSDPELEPVRGQKGYDRLFKVRPVLDHVSDNFRRHFNVGQHVAIDKVIVGNTGMLSARQNMSGKPNNHCIKVWMACDSKTSYLSKFHIYQGLPVNSGEHGLGYSVVTSLTDDLHGSHRQIYFDKYFTSIRLMENLLANGLYACGTVRANRQGFPVELKKPKDVRKRGDLHVLQKKDSNLTASVWKDKKLVHHLSTLSKPDECMAVQKGVGPNDKPVLQPSSAGLFNQHIGAVVQHNQLTQNFNVGKSEKKWWRCLLWFLINSAMVNAFIIFKETSQLPKKKKNLTHLEFCIAVARDLMACHLSRKRQRPDLEALEIEAAKSSNGHVNCKLNRPKGRCTYHRKYLNKRKETFFGCALCNIHLCRDGCHAKFHSMGEPMDKTSTT